MIGAEVLWFAAGVFVGVIILAVFDGVRMWDQHVKMCDLETELFEVKEQVIHLDGLVYPRFVVGSADELIVKRYRSKLYDRYEDLVEPGTETLGPFGQEEST